MDPLDPLIAFLIGALAGAGVGAISALVAVIRGRSAP